MKKRILAAILALTMMASMIAVPTFATEPEQNTEVGYCQHCKQVIPEDQWLPWSPNNTDPYSGHYYLTEDTSSQDAQITISLDDDLYRYRVCLDLRGRSYTVSKIRPFLIYGIFSIMDSVGGGEIAITGQTSNANGAFCQMSKKESSVDGSGELNLYSGTIRRIDTDAQLVAKGGVVYMSGQSTLNVYGGKIVGGKVTPRLTSKNEPVDGVYGGTIYATNANINIYGGTVTGGVADNTPLVLSDGTTKTYDVYGGNIYATAESKIVISGGSVENGYSDTYGGNLCLRSSTLEVTGGVVSGGYAGASGGNIMALDNTVVKVSGGVIRDGVAFNRGGNLFVNKNVIDIEITGGEIYGDISVGKYKSFTISGTPKIYMGLSNGLRLQSTNTDKVDVSGLEPGAVIYLDGVDQVFTNVLETPETYLAYFKDAIRADISVDDAGALKITQGNTGFCPHCWQTGNQAAWTVWANDTKSLTEDVHYYLADACSRASLISIGSSDVKTNDVVFDMAGKTWTTSNTKVCNIYSTLSLVDSVGGGKVTGTGIKDVTKAGYGGLILGVTADSELNLYSGTLQRTISGEENMGVLAGGIVSMTTGSSMNVYGGTIRDGISATVSTSLQNCSGGNVRALGSFTMTAGALIGGKTYANSYTYQDTETPIVVDGKETTFLGKGGNLYAEAETNISGGHIVGGAANLGGGVYIAKTATANITGGMIRDNAACETGGLVAADAELNFQGGNIYIEGDETNRQELTLSGVIVSDGSAKEQGGNLYVTDTDLTLRNIIITDGRADTAGGNVYLTKTVVCDMYDSVLGNGVAGTNGGNLYGLKGVALNIHSGLVCGGIAGTSGGNLYSTGMNITGGTVTGGNAGDKGGNIYVLKSGQTLHIEDDAEAATPAPVISNGVSVSNGTNIYLGDGNTGYLTGITVRGGGVYTYFNASLTITDCTVEGITANDASGNGVYSGGALTLKGNTVITNQRNKSCIYIHGNGSLNVDESFTGAASVAFGDTHFENLDAPQGSQLADQNSAGGVFTGKLFLEGRGTHDYGLPAIFAVSGDQKLYIASTAVVDKETGGITWYKDASSAAAEIQTGEYLRLYGTDNTMTLNKDVTVDLNGNNLTVSGSGTVYGFDSANDDYDGNGVVSAAGVTVAPDYFAPNGNQYVTLTEADGSISFHRLGMRIARVNLRPSVSGVYYEGVWETDAVLAQKVNTFGVALSVENMPGQDFASDSDTQYTQQTKDRFASGTVQTSVLVQNILKKGENNAERGATKIYAIPYVTIDNGVDRSFTVVSDDNNFTRDGIAWSLQDVMQSVNRIWPKLSDTQQTAIKNTHNEYPEALGTWDLYNITAAVNGTAAVRPLKILTLGHSLTVDSCHMLNMVAAAEGYSEEFIIGTLYYSGCQFYKHVNFLTNDSPVYSLYISSSKTPDAPPTIAKDVTMKYGLKYDDWDIIIIQGGVFEIVRENSYVNGDIQTIQSYVNEHKTNPNAIFAYHMPWAPPVDNDLRDMYPKTPNSYYTNYATFNDDRSALFSKMTYLTETYIMPDSSFIYFIPSGTAIENALSSYLVEKDLHRDYAHASDLGRLIASYTWYCTFAGVDHLDDIQVDAIPKAFLKSTADKSVDRVLTDMEKAIVIESVNNALAYPLEMTQSVYTTAPAN